MLEAWLPIVWPEVWFSFGSPPAPSPVLAPAEIRSAGRRSGRRRQRPGHERPGHERPGHERPGHERPGRIGDERPGDERPGHERPRHERFDGRQPGQSGDPEVPPVRRLLRAQPAAEPHVDRGRHHLHLPGPAGPGARSGQATHGSCDGSCQRWVSACCWPASTPPGSIARSRFGVRARRSFRAPGRSPQYTQREATYFGNLFIPGQPRFLCLAPGQTEDQRVCGDSLADCPMTVVGSCAQDCAVKGGLFGDFLLQRQRPLRRRPDLLRKRDGLSAEVADVIERVVAGRFHLLAQAGAGGMGAVYRARDLDHRRDGGRQDPDRPRGARGAAVRSGGGASWPASSTRPSSATSPTASPTAGRATSRWSGWTARTWPPGSSASTRRSPRRWPWPAATAEALAYAHQRGRRPSRHQARESVPARRRHRSAQGARLRHRAAHQRRRAS